MQHTRHFPNEVVASPHHLASAAGAAVLRAGGNAVDGAVAANLVLSVVTPYMCGAGGDLFAIVAEPDGTVHALQSAGRTPAGLTIEAVRRGLPEPHGATLPELGALPVSVPGAVAGWHALLERHGTMEFGRVAEDAVRLAEEGFPVSPTGAGAFARGRQRHVTSASWQEAFGDVAVGQRLRQPRLAAFLRTIADDGPDALYGGPLGEQLAAFLQEEGSSMTVEDLAAHEVTDVTPMTTTYGDLEVLELPPPTQGVTALQALGTADRLRRAHDDHDTDEAVRIHLQVEAVRAALVDRTAHLGDPARMRVEPAELIAPERLDAIAERIDPERVGDWPPATPQPGGTAYLCAGDRDGRSISLIQSNFMGFGSGLVAPFGVGLQNRAARLSMDPDAADAVAPSVVPLHTLIPGLARRDGDVALTFGTMGGDGQPQTHLQVLDHLRRGATLQEAHADWRFVVQPNDGLVVVEGRAPETVVQGLRDRGHEVHRVDDWNGLAGHAHAIEQVDGGWAAASDPRSEGGAIGT